MINAEFYTSVNRYGNTILYRGYDASGKQLLSREKFKPKIYLLDKTGKSTIFHTMDGRPVKPVIFETMREMKEFTDRYKDIPDFEIFGNDRHPVAFIQQKFPNEIKYDLRIINTVNFDIETATGNSFPDPNKADREIRAITAYCSRDERYHVFAFKSGYSPRTKDIVYHPAETEGDMLQMFLDWWNDPFYTPDILTGWNTRFFDIPFLANRIINVLGESEAKRLSPWKLINSRDVTIMGRTQSTYEFTGIQMLDYMELFKKFAYTYGNQESYSLNHISSVVLGEKKLDYSDIGNLDELYEKDIQTYLDYNVQDVRLVTRLDEKLGFIGIVLTLAYLSGINYEDTLATVPAWDTIIYRRLCRQRVVVPLRNSGASRENFVGGYVKNVAVGKQKWVMTFDFASLYPNIIVQHNMSPEKILPGRIDSPIDQMIDGTYVNPDAAESAMAANGVRFKTDSIGVIPEIIRELYTARVDLKNKMIAAQRLKESTGSASAAADAELYENKQMAVKLMLNAGYGAIASKYFRHFDLRIAEAVTMSGQAIIRYSEKHINETIAEFLGEETVKDRVVAIDTDSCMITAEDIIEKFKPKDPVKFLDEFAKRVMDPMFERVLNDLASRHGSLEQRMVMDREVIADRGIFCSKKRYILNMIDKEGVRYAVPKLKIMGIDAVKSSTPHVCRDEMRRIFPIIMTKNEGDVQAEIMKFKERFFALEPQHVACPRGVSDVRKYADRDNIYRGGTPIHVRAALLYNKYIADAGLSNKYHLIHDGDKIKFVYLKMPNPIHENIIGFPDDHLPVELGLHDYIDYETQFEKTYIASIQNVLNAVQWTAEPVSSLESFFA